MSTSVPAQVSAETTIEFGHGGEVTLTLSTQASAQFTEERLAKMFKGIYPDVKKDLEVVAHVSSESETSAVKHSGRDFPLVFSGIEFSLGIAVTVGELSIPVENVYHIVQTWMYAAISHFCGQDVQSLTGAPAVPCEILLARHSLPISSLLCVLASAGADPGLSDSPAPDGDLATS